MKFVRTAALISLLVMGFTISKSAFATDAEEIKICLDQWKKSPFTEKSDFRVVGARVKVMGIGGNVEETTATKKPELVLIRPAVSVMSKTVLDLRNPNGWYCLKGEVAVMGKMQINLHCAAHMTSSSSGATVMGEDKSNSGTTVMGSTTVTRVGDCPDEKAAKVN